MKDSGLRGRIERFWQRVSEGMELNQLWLQFRADARASYQLYSRNVDFTNPQGMRRGRHFWNLAKQFFWAILDQLSPARRILLLIALVLIVFAGAVVWHSGEREVGFLVFDLRTVGALLLLLVLVLEVADRVTMKRDLQIAREIQMWLVPGTPPAVPGIEIAFATRPANTVAGDYYDVFSRSAPDSVQQTFLITIADVAGKSIPAALLMASFQASLKTLSSTTNPLKDLLRGINLYTCTNSQEGRRFITAFLAEFNPADRTLTYINAGHNAPLVRRAAGQIERLEVGGLPLGVKTDAQYESATIRLESGDWLCIFTDGLVEAANSQDEEYGEQRVINILNAACASSPTSVISQLMVNLDFFVGNNLPLADDVTCMLIKAS
jgi:sigma-B regulation protein RsbU (phosphoserine phosphatase)